mmetsp:Transcript_27822/g.70292  ORF Transcript_27822/g.70292 Transcript_27822/m.70292 type:complete len:355 (+) Transcript_27822:474-1538(+)
MALRRSRVGQDGGARRFPFHGSRRFPPDTTSRRGRHPAVGRGHAVSRFQGRHFLEAHLRASDHGVRGVAVPHHGQYCGDAGGQADGHQVRAVAEHVFVVPVGRELGPEYRERRSVAFDHTHDVARQRTPHLLQLVLPEPGGLRHRGTAGNQKVHDSVPVLRIFRQPGFHPRGSVQACCRRLHVRVRFAGCLVFRGASHLAPAQRGVEGAAEFLVRRDAASADRDEQPGAPHRHVGTRGRPAGRVPDEHVPGGHERGASAELVRRGKEDLQNDTRLDLPAGDGESGVHEPDDPSAELRDTAAPEKHPDVASDGGENAVHFRMLFRMVLSGRMMRKFLLTLLQREWIRLGTTGADG